MAAIPTLVVLRGEFAVVNGNDNVRLKTSMLDEGVVFTLRNKVTKFSVLAYFDSDVQVAAAINQINGVLQSRLHTTIKYAKFEANVIAQPWLANSPPDLCKKQIEEVLKSYQIAITLFTLSSFHIGTQIGLNMDNGMPIYFGGDLKLPFRLRRDKQQFKLSAEP